MPPRENHSTTPNLADTKNQNDVIEKYQTIMKDIYKQCTSKSIFQYSSTCSDESLAISLYLELIGSDLQKLYKNKGMCELTMQQIMISAACFVVTNIRSKNSINAYAVLEWIKSVELTYETLPVKVTFYNDENDLHTSLGLDFLECYGFNCTWDFDNGKFIDDKNMILLDAHTPECAHVYNDTKFYKDRYKIYKVEKILDLNSLRQIKPLLEKLIAEKYSDFSQNVTRLILMRLQRAGGSLSKDMLSYFGYEISIHYKYIVDTLNKAAKDKDQAFRLPFINSLMQALCIDPDFKLALEKSNNSNDTKRSDNAGDIKGSNHSGNANGSNHSGDANGFNTSRDANGSDPGDTKGSKEQSSSNDNGEVGHALYFSNLTLSPTSTLQPSKSTREGSREKLSPEDEKLLDDTLEEYDQMLKKISNRQ